MTEPGGVDWAALYEQAGIEWTPEEQWTVSVRGGGTTVQRPWCDCEKKGHGFSLDPTTGWWVRPCCNRPSRESYHRYTTEGSARERAGLNNNQGSVTESGRTAP